MHKAANKGAQLDFLSQAWAWVRLETSLKYSHVLYTGAKKKKKKAESVLCGFTAALRHL